jgi:hypothetical protein
VKVELPLLSPGSESLALDDPEVDSLEKLEEPEDGKETSLISLIKYFNLMDIKHNIVMHEKFCKKLIIYLIGF